jgi:hypothetical protein
MSKVEVSSSTETEELLARRKLLKKLGKFGAYTAPALLSSFSGAKAVTGVST